MAGNVLLLLLVALGGRGDTGARPAHGSGERQDSAPGTASPVLLDDMSRLLQSSIDYADAYQVVQRCAAGLFAGCSGALYLAEEPGGPLDLKQEWGRPAGSSSHFAAADCWALRRGEAYLAAGASDIACRHLREPRQAHSLCVPIMAQGSAVGILLLEDAAQSAALASVRALAKNFAGQIGLALANMKLQETLRNLSVRDPLTGLFNRRYMEESLTREISAARRKSRPLGVAICDLNQFTRFNATYGRDAGDYALREIAQLINKHIRASDIACRYGKDEIALILPEAPLEGVVMRTNQLREAIFALDLEHFGRRLEKISASFGVALFPHHGTSSGELLQQAALALASAREFGNNRVQVASVGKVPA